MQRLIVLRGVPASGKSTIAKKLRSFKKRIVWLKVDNFKPFFADDASSALEYVNGSAIAVLKYLLEQKFSVILEGVFQDVEPIKDAIKIAEQLGINHQVFQLKVDLETLIKRDKTREGIREGRRKPLERKVIYKIKNLLGNTIPSGAVVLDTKNMTIDECILFINQHFD